MDFLDHTQINEALSRLHGDRRLYCAVAFWGNGAAAHLGLPRAGQDLRIICNLAMGGTNPREIKRLQKFGAEVRHLERLHAKVYIGDSEMIVGSANVSANGLGFEAGAQANWIEAATLGPLQPRTLEWFNILWDVAKKVSPAALAAALLAWNDRQHHLPTLPSFARFDPDGEFVPLLDYYGGTDIVDPNKSVLKKAVGRDYDDEMDQRLRESFDIAGPEDREAWEEGRWVLKWTRTPSGKMDARVKPEWIRVGKYVENAWRPSKKHRWLDVMMPAEHPGAVPFEVRDKRFTTAFREVLMRDEFAALRDDSSYERPWNTSVRSGLVRPFWKEVKEAYQAIP